MVPDLPGLGGLDVGDGALLEVDVEPQEMEVVHRLQFDWVAEKVGMDERLNGWVGQELFIVDNETVVDVAVVGEMKSSVVEEVVVQLVPRVFNEGDSNVAEGRGELGANPSSPDLFVGVVAGPENAGVECICHNGCDVCGVNSALRRMAAVVLADVRVVERIARGFRVDGQGVGIILALPLLNEGVDSIDQAVLWD